MNHIFLSLVFSSWLLCDSLGRHLIYSRLDDLCNVRARDEGQSMCSPVRLSCDSSIFRKEKKTCSKQDFTSQRENEPISAKDCELISILRRSLFPLRLAIDYRSAQTSDCKIKEREEEKIWVTVNNSSRFSLLSSESSIMFFFSIFSRRPPHSLCREF